MLMLMNAWMMLVLMKCMCQMQCLTLGCYTASSFFTTGMASSSFTTGMESYPSHAGFAEGSPFTMVVAKSEVGLEKATTRSWQFRARGRKENKRS